jgi:hypothetical protein
MLEIKSLIYLRKILDCPFNLKILQHVKEINIFLLILLGQPAWKDYLSFNFLTEISNLDQSDKQRHYDLYFTLKDTISMFQDLGVYEPQKQVKIRSIHQLNELHDLAILKLYGKNSRQIKHIPFNQTFSFNMPTWLIPIGDSRKLYEEGSVMNHCIYSYQEAILDGECAAFSVQTITERATLLIKKDINEQWRIVDIRKKFNERVSSTLNSAVSRWLEEENRKIRMNSNIYDHETDNYFVVF